MLFSLGAWLAACCGLGALLLWVWPHVARVMVAIAALGFAAIMLLPIDQWLLLPLENRFPPYESGQKLAGIIVLGGALDAALSADRARPSLNGAAERMTEFVTLARRNPEIRLVFTGGPNPNRPDGPPEADSAGQLVEQLGLPIARVAFESASRTTWDNAVLSFAQIKPARGDIWLLVTSAAHMARSVGAFRRAGWHVVADPVGYKSFRLAADRGTRGFGERMLLIDVAMHEWLGLLGYDIMGRSSALFPQP